METYNFLICYSAVFKKMCIICNPKNLTKLLSYTKNVIIQYSESPFIDTLGSSQRREPGFAKGRSHSLCEPIWGTGDGDPSGFRGRDPGGESGGEAPEVESFLSILLQKRCQKLRI